MAKFVTVGYGSQGQGTNRHTGEGYTYIVNDNVRTGDKVAVAVMHAGANGKIFGTTGKILSSTKSELKAREQMGENKDKPIASAFTAKELGYKQTRGATGKFQGSTHDKYGNYIAGEGENIARGKGMEEYQKQLGAEYSSTEKATRSVETYEEYAKQFTGD